MVGPAAGLAVRNPNVQRLRRLARRRRARSDEGRFVVEGPVLVVEALASGRAVEAAYVAADARETADLRRALDELNALGLEVRTLAPGVLEKVADTVTPQGIIAVVEGGPSTLDQFLRTRPRGLVLVLAGVGDPGNAGTLVRVAEATGAAGVVFTGGAVDPLGPKTVRAAAGSAFRVPLVEETEASAAVAALRGHGFRVVATSTEGGDPYTVASLDGDVGLLLGSEPHGLDERLLDLVDQAVSIPMQGAVDSLNVAIAGSLLCFEYARRRSS
jgi:RNA methyltransferase, TrmH family